MVTEQGQRLSKEQMEARMQEIASKNVVTPQELKELAYLVWDIDPEPGSENYCGDYVLPNKEKPEILLHPSLPEEDGVDITILDGLTEDSGEIIRLANNEGQLEWRIGVWDNYQSKFLGRVIWLENVSGKPLLSDFHLTNEDCAKVAQKLFDTYQRSKLVPAPVA